MTNLLESNNFMKVIENHPEYKYNIIVFYGSEIFNTDEKHDYDKLLSRIKSNIETIVEYEYIIIFFFSEMKTYPNLFWIIKNYINTERKYKKNLKSFIIVHPSSKSGMWVKFMMRIINRKFYSKILTNETLEDLLKIFFNIRHNIASNPTVLRYERQINPKAFNQLFGIDIKYIVNDNGEINKTIEQMFNIVSIQGSTIPGIFRQSATRTEIIFIRDFIEFFGEIPVLNRLSIIGLSQLVKEFFRKLPIPLFSPELCDKCLKSWTDISMKTHEYKLEYIHKNILDHMGIKEKIIFYKLKESLTEIIRKKDITKMDSYNLAVVMGPNLLFSKNREEDLKKINKWINILQLLLE